MLAEERKNKIWELILQNKSVLSSDLCKKFNVTNETVRKTLIKLEEEGKIIRTYGGAFIDEGVQNEVHADIRETIFTKEKEKIGKCCVSMIHPGDTIFIDESTTCCAIAREIKSINDLTVFTNSLKVFHILEDCENIKLMLAGGQFDKRNGCFVGNETIDFLENYYFDKCFVSCRGVDLDIGVTDGSEKNGQIRKCAIKQSGQKILVVNKTKLNLKKYYKICGLERIDKFVIDDFDGDDQKKKWEEYLKENSVELIIADKEDFIIN